MPKCENCKYLVLDDYESQIYTCKLFGNESDGVMFIDEGCRYSKKTLEKKAREISEHEDRQADGWHIWGLEGDNAHLTLNNEIYKAVLNELVDKEVAAKMYEQLKVVILKEWETDLYKYKKIGHITGNWVSEEQFRENLRLKGEANKMTKEQQ